LPHDPPRETPTPTPARVWGDQWLRVAEKVLKGLNHQLTNRVTGIDAIVGLLDPTEKPDERMLALVKDEVEKLQALLLLYRLMPAEPTDRPEAVRLQDIVPRVAQLHSHHADLSSVSCSHRGDPDTPPVLVRMSALMRCLLVLLESGAGNAYRSGSTVPISLTYEGTREEVCITLQAVSPRGQLPFDGPGSVLHAVRDTLHHADGVVVATLVPGETSDMVRYEMRLPSLAAARAREMQAAAVRD
jgi:hypothetical protein